MPPSSLQEGGSEMGYVGLSEGPGFPRPPDSPPHPVLAPPTSRLNSHFLPVLQMISYLPRDLVWGEFQLSHHL